MSELVDIHLIDLLLFTSLLVLPALALSRWKLLDMSYGMFVSVFRMTAQLLLVGFYLRYIFELNHLWLNLGWLLVMITVANINILGGARLAVRKLFWVSQLSLVVAIGVICVVFLLVLVRAEALTDARYLIPIAGMLLGNCLQANIRALETFYSELRDKEASYHADLLLGATVVEAVQPFFRRAVRAALEPNLRSMATLGIVFLPGMMTGQILGGALPLTAAKYQIAIMIGIFLSSICAIGLNLRLSLRVAFDPSGLLKQEVFTRRAE